jgi:hypothetical protein
MRDLCRLIGWTVVDLFRSRATLEAEMDATAANKLLRRTAPTKHAFSAIDWLMFVGLYWLFPSVRDALAIVKPGPDCPLGSRWVQVVLALEIAPP